MKQLLFGVATLLPLLLNSCSNEEQTEYQQTGTAKAVFGWQLVSEENSMTRGVTADAALAHIRSLLPTDAELNKTGIDIYRTGSTDAINVSVGKTYTLYTGGYWTDWQYKRSGFKHDTYLLLAYPCFVIQTEWEITPEVEQYTLPAVYTCSALVWDNTEAQLELNGSVVSTMPQSDDGLCAAFLTDLTAGAELTLRLLPVNTEEFAECSCTITAEQLVEGHYYRLSCKAAKGQFSHTLQFDDFVEGTFQ